MSPYYVVLNVTFLMTGSSFPVQQENVSGHHFEDPQSSHERQYKTPLLRTPVSNDGDRNGLSRFENLQPYGYAPQDRQNRIPLLSAPVPVDSRIGIQPVPAASRTDVRPLPHSDDYMSKDIPARPTSGDERAKARGCDAIMHKAEIITRRIMSCISPDDPEVDNVRNCQISNLLYFNCETPFFNS